MQRRDLGATVHSSLSPTTARNATKLWLSLRKATKPRQNIIMLLYNTVVPDRSALSNSRNTVRSNTNDSQNSSCLTTREMEEQKTKRAI